MPSAQHHYDSALQLMGWDSILWRRQAIVRIDLFYLQTTRMLSMRPTRPSDCGNPQGHTVSTASDKHPTGSLFLQANATFILNLSLRMFRKLVTVCACLLKNMPRLIEKAHQGRSSAGKVLVNKCLPNHLALHP